MKTFKDLVFNHIPNLPNHIQAVMYFNNGYGISCINYKGAYCDEKTYEVGIMYEGELTYNTHISDDVLGYQTPKDISIIMKQIQKL